MTQYKLGLKNAHDPKYETFEKLIVDEAILPVQLPSVVDYKWDFPAIDDQGQLGTCVAFSTRKLLEFYRQKRLKNKDLISARALYAAAKAFYENGDPQDDGLNPSDCLNVAKDHYLVNESDYPSLPDNSPNDFPSYLQQAPSNLWKTDFLIKSIVTVQPTVDSMKKALYKQGPMLLGINFANSWFATDSTGVLPIPDSASGGHAMTICGYKVLPSGEGAFIIANNWTTDWADKGFCYLKFSFAEQYPDFWPTDLFTIVI